MSENRFHGHPDSISVYRYIVLTDRNYMEEVKILLNAAGKKLEIYSNSKKSHRKAA